VQKGKRLRFRRLGLFLICLDLAACAGDPQDRIGRIYTWKLRPTDKNVERIRACLEDPDRDVRAMALHALISLGIEDGQAISLEALRDEDGFVRATAARCLGEMGVAVAAPALAERLSSDPDWHVRKLAAESLTVLGGTEAAEALVRALEDPVRGVRLAAVSGAGELSPDAAFEILAGIVLEDPDWEVRVHAARAIGRSSRPETAATLEAARNDPNEFVRAAATAALRSAGRVPGSPGPVSLGGPAPPGS